jgi:quercetin dioxygenase-like cupin family protein
MTETDVIHDPARRQRYVFRRTAVDTGGELLEAEVWAEPEGDVPEHVHPSQEERFEVLSGNVTFRLEGVRRRAAQGETLVVPPGTRHSFVNDGEVEAHLIVQIRPALELQEFLEAAAGLARARKITRGGAPRSPRALIELAMLARHFRSCTYLARPPVAMQNAMTAPLAALGRALGYKTSDLVAAARSVP